MTKLFSYVVDHDLGFAPNPEGNLCSLVHCKFRRYDSKRRNIVEMANVGDWILGSGGESAHSAGNSKIIFLMHVDNKISFIDYLSNPNYATRFDCFDRGSGNTFALLSNHFYYFGSNAIDISLLPESLSASTLFKKGPGYRKDLTEDKTQLLIQFFANRYSTGVHGAPCNPKNPSIYYSLSLCKNKGRSHRA